MAPADRVLQRLPPSRSEKSPLATNAKPGVSESITPGEPDDAGDVSRSSRGAGRRAACPRSAAPACRCGPRPPARRSIARDPGSSTERDDAQQRAAGDPILVREARAVVEVDSRDRDAEAREHRGDRARLRPPSCRRARRRTPISRVSSSAVSLLLSVSISSTIWASGADVMCAISRASGTARRRAGSVAPPATVDAARCEHPGEGLHGVERGSLRGEAVVAAAAVDDERAERTDVGARVVGRGPRRDDAIAARSGCRRRRRPRRSGARRPQRSRRRDQRGA